MGYGESTRKKVLQQLHDRLEPILTSPSKLQILAAELEIMLFIKFEMIKQAKESLKILLDRQGISFEQKNRIFLINKVLG